MAFTTYRIEIARIHGAQVYVDKMKEHAVDYSQLDKDAVFVKEWKRLQTEQPDLFVFVSHSDMEGHWTIKECQQVLSVLKSAQSKLPKQPHWGHIGDWQATTTKFIKGLEYCVERHRRAVFC